MRLNPVSDLHLEHDCEPYVHPHAGADLVVLAGDIDALRRPERLLTFLAHGDVLAIPGNHDFWGLDFASAKDRLAEYADSVNRAAAAADLPGQLTFVPDCGTIVDRGVRFVCATLWTDLDRGDPLSILRIRAQIADFSRIAQFTPERWLEEHGRHREFIAASLAEPFAGPTVVVTHHAPTRSSISAPYAGSPVNGAYASALDELVAEPGVELWIHGHIHTVRDHVELGPRLVCNPRGYAHERTGYAPGLVIEV